MNTDAQNQIKQLTQSLRADEPTWDILTMLRGADSDTDDAMDLKWLTTARIRGLIGVLPGNGAAVRSYPLDEEEKAQRDHLLEKAPRHFRDHYDAAVGAIRQVYGYDIIAERWLCQQCDEWLDYEPAFGALADYPPPQRLCPNCQ